MKNKVISLLLAITLVVTAVGLTAVSAFAAGTSLTVSKVSENASTVTVAVGISGNSGIAALGVNLTFDSTLLKGVSVESAGVTSDAGMVAWGSFSDGNVRIIIEEGNSGEGTKKDGTVCIVTFSKLSTVKDGTSASFTASVIASATYGPDDESVEIADGSATLTLKKAETTTKKPTTTKAPTTTKKTTTTKKATTTKTPATTKQNVVSPTLAGVTVPTTAEETTTEETTTEETTTEEWTTEYESYSYTAPENEVDEEDDEKSDNTKRIIAIVVVVVCIGAAAAIYFTKRK